MDLTKVIYDLFTWHTIELLSLVLLSGVILILVKVFTDKLPIKINKFIQKFNNNPHKISTDVIEIITSVNIKLSDLRRDMNADRAFIYHFHNGLQFTSKYPSWKVSNTYLKTKPGVDSRRKNFQNVEVSLIWDEFLKSLWIDKQEELPKGVNIIEKNKECVNVDKFIKRNVYVINVEELTYTGIIKLELEEMGVNTFLMCPILDSEHQHIIGFVGVDYNNKDEWQKLYNSEQFDSCMLSKFSSRLTSFFSKKGLTEEIIYKEVKKITGKNKI